MRRRFRQLNVVVITEIDCVRNIAHKRFNANQNKQIFTHSHGNSANAKNRAKYETQERAASGTNLDETKRFSRYRRDVYPTIR